MPALLQICIVIVTVGLLVIGVLAARMITRFSKTAEDISQLTVAVRESAARLDRVSDEARVVVASLGECVRPVQRVVDQLEAVGQRTARLSTTLLEELELPVFTAAAVIRGVRSGAFHFVQQLVHRFNHRSNRNNGGPNHE